MNELTTPFKDTTANPPTTQEQTRETLGKEDEPMIPTKPTSTVISGMDNEIPNDIALGDPQGRSIKGSSGKNIVPLNDKGLKHYSSQVEVVASPSIRLLPSTVYKTFTYLTTFYIPDENDVTTTSVKSREVISSEVSYVTEFIAPSTSIASETTTTETPVTPPESEQRETTAPSTTTTTTTVKTETTENTSPPTTPKIETSSESTSEPEEEQTTKQDEEIELIFKTLYTTYTYLTTFFQEQTSSVISHEVVETNIITQTVDPYYDVSADVASLFDKTDSVLIAPTKSQEITPPSLMVQPAVQNEDEESTEEEDHVATTEESSISTIDVEQETEITTESSLEPTPSAEVTPQIHQDVVKTYYTTYTYFTTIFVEDETEIETRTEVFTNVVTGAIQPSTVLPTTPKSELPDTPPTLETPTTENMPKPQEIEKPAVPPEILAYLEAIKKQKSQEEALELAKKVKEETNGDETLVTGESQETTEPAPPTTLHAHSDNVPGVAVIEEPEMTPNPLDAPGEVLGRMVTDVISTSSSGGGTILDSGERRINTFPDDQEISESNNHEVEPAVTLLLQTSYTTFTYFTTMYKGDASNVVSRLETVTNTVTETIRPSAIDSQPVVPTITAPSTEFTTLTYWTTFYKDGDTITNSREETISSVATPEINPSPTTAVAPLPSRDFVVGAEVQPEGNLLDNEVPSPISPVSSEAPFSTEDAVTQPDDQAADVSNVGNRIAGNDNESISPDPTTFYTTYTYFTTSYVGNSTVLNSRLETVTSIAQPTDRATGRAIGDGATAIPSVQALDTIDKPSPARATGIISTVRSSKVEDGTTTHFATDVRGTFINGLYAQVIESSTRIEKPEDSTASSATATPVLPTGVLSLNRGSIIDADEISTVYFTTRQLGTVVDGLYAKVVESTSSTKIDEERRATVTPTQTGTHRTGLVRLIEGYVEANDTTIFYRSKVIGTSIDGRYAQIIESTSSWLSATPAATASGELASSIAPSATDGNIAMSSAAFPTQVHPSPAVVESSMSDDPTTESSTEDSTEDLEDDTEDEDDDRDENGDGQKTSKRSRLTFTTKSKSFTPVIRPFASRNRPTFNPKRKGAQGATTITRTDITPTITATLAGKGNRFASSRNRISSPTGPYSSTLGQTGQFSGSRRGFSGRRSFSTSILPSGSGYASGTIRGRGSSRISPSSVFRARGSGPSSIGPGRGSSRNGPRFSSSVFASGPAGSSRYRPGIRASSTLLRGQQPSVRNEDQDDNANDYTATTIVTEETPYTEDDRYYEDDGEAGETGTIPFQTTTESIRRTTNPLLKFRRPLTLGNSPVSGRLGNTQRPPTTTTRRNGNLVRPTGSTPNRLPFLAGRTGNRPNLPTYTRPRQGQQNLFPPRGLYNRRPEATEPTETTDVTETPPPIDEGDEDQEDDEIFEDDEPIDEVVDNDYEASEQDLTSENRRSGNTAYAPRSGVVRIRPFVGRAGRVRRQASQLRALTTNRFRRPPTGHSNSPQAKTEEKPEDNPEPEDNTESTQKSKPASTSRFGGYRGRSQSSRRTNGNTSSKKNKNDSNKPTEGSTEATPSGKPRSRTKSRPSGSRSSSSSSRIKPSPTSSSSRQFTMREKESSSSASRSGYKRPSSSSSRSRSTGKTESYSRPRPPRIRGGGSRSSHTETPVSSKRTSSDGKQKTGSRSSGSRSSSGRRTSSSRNRGVNSQSRDEPRESSFEPEFDGTITVTHYIPAQATIPAVTNGVTELKYVVTARPSTQVLGPDRYSTIVGVDGQPLTVISGDVTGTNAQGHAEVTRFLLHESTTTSITRGPTSIGGRRTTFSRVIPSTVYSVENVVSTQQPTLPAANAPLANILLSQLLLGQLGQGNPLLGGLQQPQQPQQQATPTTRYDTRTTSYVTTITKHQSTVIPLTFRGKEILTTLVDSSVDVITATEFITDTVVITPTAALPTPDINSLLLLLQQPTQPQFQPQLQFQQPNPFDPLFAVTPASTQGNELPGEIDRRLPADVDYKPSRGSEDDEEEVSSSFRDEDEDEQREPERRHRSRTRKNGFGKPANSGKKEEPIVDESSVVTLYVSGKRPGEFSTVLSTVRVGEDASVLRSRRDIGNPPPVIELQASRGPSLHAAPESIMVLDGGEELVSVHSPTQSLESVVGDVGRHISATMIYA
ncbi:mucin-17-like [Neodiprion fabricii]|uniref:mucin-17-like n=1 Tax=Neodiprion fabricii TaxID=2872261 RepID=UPI001ED91560|nr:mucin-17-like [Neodiprion fabricii]